MAEQPNDAMAKTTATVRASAARSGNADVAALRTLVKRLEALLDHQQTRIAQLKGRRVAAAIRD